jgi:hypothetical protein
MTTPVPAGTPQLSTGWSETSLYSIAYNITSRVICGLYGAITPFTDVVHTDTNIDSHYVGTMSEQMYDEIAISINNPISIAFWNTDNTIKVRKIIVEFGANTYIDGQRNAIVGIDNTVTLIPKCVDENGAICTDITTVDIKNMKKLEFAMSIAGQPDSSYKATCGNGSPVVIQLTDQGRATIRFKVILPELTNLWLSIYPELYAYKPADLPKLATWAAAQPA